MGAIDGWEYGTVIVLQEVWHGQLWSARPVRVVVDRPGLIALWCPRGTPIKGPSAPWRPGREAGPEYFLAMLTQQDWLFADYRWPTDNLMLLEPGQWYGVWVSWTRTVENMGWYVNFQRPFHRSAHGVQTMDLMLDLIVDQDRSWKWKDEDEFEALVGLDIITEGEATCVRRAARSVLRDIAEVRGAFSHPWHDWRPDPLWAIPDLPPDWCAV